MDKAEREISAVLRKIGSEAPEVDVPVVPHQKEREQSGDDSMSDLLHALQRSVEATRAGKDVNETLHADLDDARARLMAAAADLESWEEALRAASRRPGSKRPPGEQSTG